jgi:hypothetical protein
MTPPIENADRIEGEVTLLRDEVAEIRDGISAIREKCAEHEVRFGNGREVMAEMKADITALKPKAPDWLKLLGVCAGFLAATLGAHYWLIEQFNDRPTSANIEKAFRIHSESGHASTQTEINAIHDVQTEQRVILDGLEKTVTGQGTKLDEILNRLPRR